MTYRSAVFKRNIELVIMYPFVLLGRLAGTLFPLKSRHTVFLFFPSADIGGSIKVNADITSCIKEQKPLIIFSKKPKNNQFRHLFDIEGVRVIDLHRYIDNKIYHFLNFFFRGVVSAWINKADTRVVFGGESIFFYKMLPHVKKGIRKVELCHLDSWINYSLGFIKYIDYRIFSTPEIKRKAESEYLKNHLPGYFFEKLHFIDNKIEIPSFKESKTPILQVLFVGRGSPQKRVHLIAETARRMHETSRPVHFSFAGDVEKIVPEVIKQYCTLYGPVKDAQELDKIYMQSDVLLLTSTNEGLPLVIMEMMARGKVIISTAVGGIPDYISHSENGLLIRETDEEKIIQKTIQWLELLMNEPELKKKMGEKNYQYALTHFNGESFCKAYKKILLTD